jgi:hypothetical protein
MECDDVKAMGNVIDFINDFAIFCVKQDEVSEQLGQTLVLILE